jgi:hypothetical protein
MKSHPERPFALEESIAWTELQTIALRDTSAELKV